VAYAGCVSKTLTPALRLGWIALPRWLIDDVMREKLFDDMGTSMLEQMALARFIDAGALGRHLRRMRPIYRRRRDTFLESLATAAETAPVTFLPSQTRCSSAGCSAIEASRAWWIPLPRNICGGLG
jgi:GntR family transcriptional regulator/MocR family aminotransferase